MNNEGNKIKEEPREKGTLEAKQILGVSGGGIKNDDQRPS